MRNLLTESWSEPRYRTRDGDRTGYLYEYRGRNSDSSLRIDVQLARSLGAEVFYNFPVSGIDRSGIAGRSPRTIAPSSRPTWRTRPADGPARSAGWSASTSRWCTPRRNIYSTADGAVDQYVPMTVDFGSTVDWRSRMTDKIFDQLHHVCVVVADMDRVHLQLGALPPGNTLQRKFLDEHGEGADAETAWTPPEPQRLHLLRHRRPRRRDAAGASLRLTLHASRVSTRTIA